MNEETNVQPTTAAQSDAQEHGPNQQLPLLALKNVVLLPRSILPVIVGRPTSIEAVEHALTVNKMLFVSAQKHQDVEQPTINDVYAHGTRATILQVMRIPNGALKILVEGVCRAHITGPVSPSAHQFLSVYVQDVPTRGLDEHTPELEAIWRRVKELYAQYTQINPHAPKELIGIIRFVHEIDMTADTIAAHLNLAFDERQSILEQDNIQQKLYKLAALLQREIAIIETERRIQNRMQQQVEKNQREYYLT